MPRPRHTPARALAATLLVGCAAVTPPLLTAQRASSAYRLPTRYLADRFVVAPVTAEGDTLLLYTDTGGGVNMVWESTVQRLQLPVERRAMGTDTASIVRLPAFAPDAAIPLPQPYPPFGEHFLVSAERHAGLARDGFLGRTWFADRVWVFDYPGQTLTLLPNDSASPAGREHRVPLGFLVDSAGMRATHFPRIQVEIDGDSVDLLFDTGAMVALSDAALAQLADGGPAERGASFIAQHLFERWRSEHPDWPVMEQADRTVNMPMIRVPEISVGGHVVGPVWFAMRPDRNFHQYMSQWMDRRIEGALGGSGLKYFRVTVDYPSAIAIFERP